VKCDPVWCAGSTMRLTAACKPPRICLGELS
jgi:hypothetical protein